VAHDAVLYMKLCRILREYMVATKGAACDLEFCKDMLQSLLGALVLLPSNASAANYLWECFKELPYLQRYWIYSEMQYKVLYHPYTHCILHTGSTQGLFCIVCTSFRG